MVSQGAKIKIKVVPYSMMRRVEYVREKGREMFYLCY